MLLLTPDPTFYPSPTMATQSPPETFACAALVNPLNDGRPDAPGLVDVDPDSSGHGRLIRQTDMPHALGLSLLRTAWLNMDWLWAGALFVTGVVVLLK